jgi:T-complex protein 1 subunit theta
MFAPQGLQSILKEGGQHFAGVDEAIVKNIEACKRIGEITQTSMGPNGMNKLLVDHLDKHIVTSDTAKMLQTLEVMHPAAKLLVLAAEAAEKECGDATNFTATFGSEMLAAAMDLLKEGIHMSDVIKGYNLAAAKCLEILEENCCWTCGNVRDVAQMTKAVNTVISAKNTGFEQKLAECVAQACVQVMPEDARKFDTDCVRCAKVIGGSAGMTQVVPGMCLVRDAYGTEKSKLKARVAIFDVGMEMTSTEAKSTVLLNSAQELMDFTKSEEVQMEDFVKGLVEAKVDVVFCKGAVQDIAMHYLNKYKIMVIKITSKFDIKRLCKALNATALVRLGKPLPEEIGYAEDIHCEELGGTKTIMIRTGDSRIATIVLRGATPHLLDELERAIDDAVNLVRCVTTRDQRFCPGGGAAEIEIAYKLAEWGRTVPGLEQYAAVKFAECFEVVPRILAKNAGLSHTKVLAALYSAHAQGQKTAGVNLADEVVTPHDAAAAGVLDHLSTKKWAIQLAVEAAMTVLRVDHIIVAKQAGGPKGGPGGARDD